MDSNVNKTHGKTTLKARGKMELRDDLLLLLKTIELLEKPFGLRYLSDILQGKVTRWMDIMHSQLETFGSMNDISNLRIRRIILHAYIDGFIFSPGNLTGNFAITDKGKRFLEKPHSWTRERADMRYTEFDFNLRKMLITLRTNIAASTDIPPFKILSEFDIEQIVYYKPMNEEELLKLKGMGKYKVEQYGGSILESVKKVENEKERQRVQRLAKTVKSPSYQEAKKLFLEGKSIEEIAAIKKVRESTVVSYLSRLHHMGEIDMRPWIEEYLDGEVLFKGAEYFKNTDSPELRRAYEDTGLDYSVLRFCKLYVSDVATQYEEISI